ncbi:hypothetical protein [Ruegeria atlantica]|uniref:hypothetical protein n=1 Tax=Ruegeria atlantica TaxID=81569 RepID=UPI0024948D58|nr:hypothetical protein [Ruegeria atlantica]
MRGFSLTIAIVVLSMNSGSALACTVTAVNEGWKKLEVETSCAFKNAGHGRHYSFSGEPVVDFGNGRVGQRLISGDLCHSRQNLYFPDCSLGESIIITGKRIGPLKTDGEIETENSGPKTLSAPNSTKVSHELTLEPLGPVRISAQTTVTEVLDIATKNNYRATFLISEFFQAFAPTTHRHLDSACGCKLYYPDSPGAKL